MIAVEHTVYAYTSALMCVCVRARPYNVFDLFSYTDGRRIFHITFFLPLNDITLYSMRDVRDDNVLHPYPIFVFYFFVPFFFRE